MKNKYFLTFIIFPILVIVAFIVFLVTVDLVVAEQHKLVVILLGTSLVIFDFLFLFFGYVVIFKKRERIAKTFDYYVESVISSTGVGLIAFDNDGTIIWVSDFILIRISRKLIGKRITSISTDFRKKYMNGEVEFNFFLDASIYKAIINSKDKTIVIKDVTNEDVLLKQYVNEQLVLAEVEIDNFQQFQLSLSEEELFKIQTKVIEMLDDLVDEYNIIYRQYANGKYIIMTTHKVLDQLVETNFTFLDSIRRQEIMGGVWLTVSMGFASETMSRKEMLDMAKDALLQSQSRGGDQVTVLSSNYKPKYYGSKTQISTTISRVKIKKISELFEKVLDNPNIDTVIIYGHKFADLDAVGAAIGIGSICKSYKKNWFIQNNTFDTTSLSLINSVMTKQEQKKVFIKPNRATKLNNKRTAVVIVDTAEVTRIENPRAFVNVDPENIFVFDHHRATNLPNAVLPSNTYIDSSASSTSEIVTELTVFLKKKIRVSAFEAQMLLNGICLDTSQFKKQTSSRTFNAASILEEFGASAAKADEILKIPEKDGETVVQIISTLKEIKPGYFLCAYKGEATSDVISIAANEVLRTRGRKASFVIAKLPNENGKLKLSARSSDVNIQKIVEELGGGGHFNAAAMVTSDGFEEFKDNVIQAIVLRSD